MSAEPLRVVPDVVTSDAVSSEDRLRWAIVGFLARYNVRTIVGCAR